MSTFSKDALPLRIPVTSVNPFMGTDSLHETAASPRYVRVGPFHIDRQRRQVYRSNSKLRLHGKTYQLLLVLIEK